MQRIKGKFSHLCRRPRLTKPSCRKQTPPGKTTAVRIMPTIFPRTPVRARRNAEITRGRIDRGREHRGRLAHGDIQGRAVDDVQLDTIANASLDVIQSVNRDTQPSSSQSAASSAAPSVAAVRSVPKKRSYFRRRAFLICTRRIVDVSQGRDVFD